MSRYSVVARRCSILNRIDRFGSLWYHRQLDTHFRHLTRSIYAVLRSVQAVRDLAFWAKVFKCEETIPNYCYKTLYLYRDLLLQYRHSLLTLSSRL